MVYHPMRNTTTVYLSGREEHCIQEEREHEGKFEGRNTQVTLKN